MLDFLKPLEFFGRKFDRGSVLFEFQALREPERTQFPQIGAWLRAKGVEFREVPTPQMLWRGRLWPDLYIANQLDVLNEWPMGIPAHSFEPSMPKSAWRDDLPLEVVSYWLHGVNFHETFIEPMALKISGHSTRDIVARYHRALWLPIFHPQTLRARASIRTPFFYPAAGYAGRIAEMVAGHGLPNAQRVNPSGNDWESAALSVAFVVAEPRAVFSAAFIVDDSPIYRVTDQDACAGIDAEFHRFVVEYRGECLVAQELTRLQLTYHPRHMAFGSARLQLPTLANVARGWRPRPHINAQLLAIMEGK